MRYLVAVLRPAGWDPASAADPAMRRDIDALNDEMKSAGVRVFVGGLQPPATALSLRRQPGGELIVNVGSHSKASEFVDGFWVLETTGLDAALAWGRKAAAACRASIEVRPFH